MINSITRFELSDQRIILPVTLNGHGPFDFILDTGTDATCIDPESTGRLDTAAGLLTLGLGRAEITVDGLRVEPLNAARILLHSGRAVAGLIGADLLFQAVCSLDYDKRQIMLLRPGDLAYTGGGVAVALLPDTPLPIVQGQVRIGAVLSAPGRFLLDTAERSHLLLTPAFVSANSLPSTGPPALWSDRAEAPHPLARADLTLGPLALHGLVAALAVPLNLPVELDGVIGAEVFQHFRTVLDRPGNRALFEVIERSSQPYRFDASGLSLAWAEGHPVVRHVMPASPAAAAGIGPGDRIEAVAGVPVEETTLAAIRVTLRDAGETVVLSVRRGEAARDVLLHLKPLV